MGTETRIGIATGLVIVVVASVYFFYGSDRSEGDLLMVSSASLDEVPAAAPAATARKDTAVRRPASKPPASKVNKPKRGANRPAAKPRGAAAHRTPARVAQHRATPNARRTPTRNPNAGGTRVAAAHRKPPTRLRSEPSSILIDATKKHLEQSPTGAKPTSNGTPNRVRPRRTPGAQPAPKAGKAGVKPGGLKPGALAPTKKPRVGAAKAKPKAKPTRPNGASPKNAASPTPRRSPKKPVVTWPRRHAIVAGDTLSGISTRYYGTSRSVARILKANARVKNPRNLKIGNVLVIPAPTHLATAKRGSAPKAVKLTAGPKPRPTKAGKPPSTTYRVRSGDSFYTIAKRMYGKPGRWKDIYAANRGLVKNDPKRLRPGMVLRIPK